ncbi:MAG: UDP-N-acetylglucosamine--N-acetylmuramyl-(pentapeptide) pyrophosphoryl-undecaprenol N-acetylglucosamine transferase, partial [Oscillospiraceae bacterium]|nr:UDP-N-acetylglucosamine--N-acetylmuramyl-(pentapeptide) pyrophosphoryl-undecaprenol N-acetylglucosamine transferase [Oscillospiraceae bacterium]
MKFLIACGGTAGHINPGLAAADALRALLPGSDFLFVGSGRKMESKLVPEAGYKLRNIVMRGLERGISPKTLVSDAQALWLLVSASRKAAKLVREFAPDFVLGTGGYICYPVLTAAARLGIKTAIHESNAVPGLTSKLLSGKVTRVFTAFEGMGMLFSASDRVVATGTPVRSDFFGYNREKARKELGIDADTRLVVSFWGSLGASKMNEVMAEMIRRNAERRAFCQIHAIGGASDIE